MLRASSLLLLLLASCDRPAGNARGLRHDATIDSTLADAALADARPDAARAPLACSFEQITPVQESFSSSGIERLWAGIDMPVSMQCCSLTPRRSLCIITEEIRSYIPTDQGTLSIATLVDRARVFKRGGRSPFAEFVLSARLAGPMNGLPGKPMFHATIDAYSDALEVTPVDDAVCRGSELACDEPAGCSGYRAALAPLVRRFCDGRGRTAW